MENKCKIIKVNFTSYKNMPFGVWVDWCKSELNWFEYFIGEPLNELDKHQIDFVNNWLGFLVQPYELQNNKNLLFDTQTILEKTLRQKIDAITLLQQTQKVYEFLPKFLEIFGNKTEKEVLEMPFYLAYEQGFFYTEQLFNCEKRIYGKFKKHNPTSEEIAAGYNELAKFSNYGLYDNLAGGDVLKHDAVLNLDVETAHTKIVYNNHLQHYQKITRYYPQKTHSKKMILEGLIETICKQQGTIFVNATEKESDDVLTFSDLKTFHIILDSLFGGRIERSQQGIISGNINFSIRILKASELDNTTKQRNTIWHEAWLLMYSFLYKLDYVFYDTTNKIFVYTKGTTPQNFVKVVQTYNNVEWTHTLNVFSENTDGLQVRNVNIVLNTQFNECLTKTIYE